MERYGVKKRLKFHKLSSASELYEVGKYEIIKLFNKNIRNIIYGKIIPIDQKVKYLISKKKC